ncbi:serine/threonine-protein kinase [Jannaschia sp. CCS1]|uniref:serine/threonine-protein kinase n=1 Tax=Jannaschia sp. (strain CCS1) TaxID=290400 RepID=UPI00140FCE73|nr:serine/threonine-protein kinase [Jannaschia sp. CCS1]
MADLPPTQRGPDAVTHQLPAGELPAGWKLLEGQYEIVRLIASGGFGITYLARDTLGRDVAVKECFPLGLAQRAAMTHTVSATSAGTSEHFETARGQFLREARMLADLRHPNVVHVQSLFEENGTAYMAMDFIHGRDLHEDMAGDALPPTRVLDLARDLLGALDYIHAQGVLHRDIKPQNIRIDQFGMPMLIDFGAARAETQARSRMAGTFRVVTDGYSPHEFYVAGASQGPHSDLYALAATLYHVITGAAPVPADERASAVATGQPDPYVPIAGSYAAHDARLLKLIDRALRMIPAERPPNASAWLTALTDAQTRLVTPPATEEIAAPRGRLWPGLALGVGLMGAAGAAIWVAQPDWLTPGMDEVTAQVGALETQLQTSEAERAASEAALAASRATLAEAEAEVQRLEAADGDMAATLADLDAARAARDAAAAEITALQGELEGLGDAAGALDQAQRQAAAESARADAAEAQIAALDQQIAQQAASLTETQSQATALEAQISELTAADATARAQITALEASLTEATGRLVEARTTAALLTRAEEDLTTAETALGASNIRAARLEAQLQQAEAQGTDLAAAQAEIQALEASLAASAAAQARLSEEIAGLEAARAQLTEDIATMEAAPLPNLGELAELRARVAAAEAETADLQTRIAASDADTAELRAQIAAMEAEVTALTATLAETEAALAASLQAQVAARADWGEQATLRAPNGTFTLLPRFSWDNRRIAAVDSAGGITLFDRSTGAYEAHLARGIPDQIVRLGFSAGGSYLIATTPNGSPNRLYDVRARREILRFDPVTVTTANRAISTDEAYFVFTRAAGGGQVNIVITAMASLREAGALPMERTLTTVPQGTPVRIAFAETSNQITVLTPASVQVFDTDGRLRRTAPNGIGSVAALSPIGGDQGFLVLRSSGEVVIFNDLIAQDEVATIPPRADYALYRLSGDRLSFLRANDETWDVIDLVTGDIRGSGPIDTGSERASLSISADGQMIFIGATDTRPARMLDVATGLELQEFGTAAQGYFSFDNTHLATGSVDGISAQIWRLAGAPTGPDLSGCAVLERTMDGIPILASALERGRGFTVDAGGDVSLRDCAEAQDAGLEAALARGRLDLTATERPDVAINILGTSRAYTLNVGVEGACAPTIMARFGADWAVGRSLRFEDEGEETRPLDVWLATPPGVTCEARISLSGEVE